MSANPKLSIIVPIYNVSAYLRQSLDSIQAQTFNDWECILVDDGSTDNSPAICDDYASKDHRFKVIHKKNGGVSSARNAGLLAASAELIGFVDPDDWTEPEMFQKLYDLIIEYDADIAQIDFVKEYKGRRKIKHFTDKVKVISGKEALREIEFDKMPSFLWNKLHRKHIITCAFPEGRTFEDVYIYGRWLKNVNKMVLAPTPLYHYRMRKGSIVHSNASENRLNHFLSCLDQMKLVDEEDGIKDVYRKNAYINKSAVKSAKIIARLEKNKIDRDKNILKISKVIMHYPLPSPIYMGLKTWFRAKLLRKNPQFFSVLMRGVHYFDFDYKDRENRYFD